jgi:hypothetical protein
MKKILLILCLSFICQIAGGGELKHIVKDSDMIIDFTIWDKVYCKNSCWTNIFTKEEFEIFKKQGKHELNHWSFKKCQNCGIIITFCAGMDWFRYEIPENRPYKKGELNEPKRELKRD